MATHLPDSAIDRLPSEEIARVIIKLLPAKKLGLKLLMVAGRYDFYTPAFYTLLTPLFSLLYGSHNLHCGYFENGDEQWQEAQRALSLLLARTCGFSDADRLLDVGCGVGGPAVDIATETGANITGINITPAHVQHARNHARNRGLEGAIRIVQGDALAMPFDDNHFTSAYAIESVSHIPNRTRLFSEITRVIAPGGRFGMVDVCFEDVDAVRDHEQFAFFNEGVGVRGEDWIRNGEIPAAMESAGLKHLKTLDLTQQVYYARGRWMDYITAHRDEISRLYGRSTYDLVMEGMLIGREVLQQYASYKIWVGQKPEGA